MRTTTGTPPSTRTTVSDSGHTHKWRHRRHTVHTEQEMHRQDEGKRWAPHPHARQPVAWRLKSRGWDAYCCRRGWDAHYCRLQAAHPRTKGCVSRAEALASDREHTQTQRHRTLGSSSARVGNVVRNQHDPCGRCARRPCHSLTGVDGTIATGDDPVHSDSRPSLVLTG